MLIHLKPVCKKLSRAKHKLPWHVTMTKGNAVTSLLKLASQTEMDWKRKTFALFSFDQHSHASLISSNYEPRTVWTCTLLHTTLLHGTMVRWERWHDTQEFWFNTDKCRKQEDHARVILCHSGPTWTPGINVYSTAATVLIHSFLTIIQFTPSIVSIFYTIGSQIP